MTVLITNKNVMIKPINNKVLVRAFKGDSISTGGIFVPDNCVKDGCRVEVVAVGNGSTSRPMKLKPKDIGYRVQEWGVPIQDNGEMFYLMEDSAIIALEN
jgi:co-chaperonin GroES (HSP10)